MSIFKIRYNVSLQNNPAYSKFIIFFLTENLNNLIIFFNCSNFPILVFAYLNLVLMMCILAIILTFLHIWKKIFVTNFSFLADSPPQPSLSLKIKIKHDKFFCSCSLSHFAKVIFMLTVHYCLM